MRKVFRDMERFLKYRVKIAKRRMVYLAYSSVCKKVTKNKVLVIYGDVP